MKQFILTVLLLITATATSAQQKDDENFAKRLFEARLAEISLRLNLTDEQKSKFAPIYEQYCNEMSELRERPRNGHLPPMKPGMHSDRKSETKPGMHHNRKLGMKTGMRPERKSEMKNDMRPESKENISDAEKVKHMKERMEKQKKAQEIRLNYADKFATVLSDKQLVDFYEVENEIQGKLHKRAFRNRN